jgi:hypothetical protein
MSPCKCGCGAEVKRLFKHGHNSHKPSVTFFDYIEVPGGDGCWNFISIGANGYGSLVINGKKVSAHRHSYEYFYGVSPGSKFVLHECDNPRCVRPDHLFLGTNKENMIDASRKGRIASGVRCGRAIFTPKDVLFMREKYDGGEMRVVDIARHFSCNQATVSMIVHRHNWKHLEASQ